MIFPVRYKDFGKGDGVVEEYLLEHVQSFSSTSKDMIMTMSQGWPFRFDVDYMSSKHRGGASDNMFMGESTKGYNSDDFGQLTSGDSLYETKLPQQEIVSVGSDKLFTVRYNTAFSHTKGSGGNYLSNEIFYRVARMRVRENPNLSTGHLHIPLVQASVAVRDYLVRNNFKNADKITLDKSAYISQLIRKIEEIIKTIQ